MNNITTTGTINGLTAAQMTALGSGGYVSNPVMIGIACGVNYLIACNSSSIFGSGFTTSTGLPNLNPKFSNQESINYSKLATFATLNILQIKCGYGFTLFLMNTGEVMGYGNRIPGLGHSGNIVRIPQYVLVSSADQTSTRLSGISEIDCGHNYAVFLKTDGTVMTSGINSSGQVGDGTIGTSTIDRLNPVFVLATGSNQGASRLSGISQVACGDSHTVFLTTGGNAMACGMNDKGQLGDGTSGTNRRNPVFVLASGSN